MIYLYISTFCPLLHKRNTFDKAGNKVQCLCALPYHMTLKWIFLNDSIHFKCLLLVLEWNRNRGINNCYYFVFPIFLQAHLFPFPHHRPLSLNTTHTLPKQWVSTHSSSEWPASTSLPEAGDVKESSTFLLLLLPFLPPPPLHNEATSSSMGYSMYTAGTDSPGIHIEQLGQ